jgi:hypothetical protein
LKTPHIGQWLVIFRNELHRQSLFPLPNDVAAAIRHCLSQNHLEIINKKDSHFFSILLDLALDSRLQIGLSSILALKTPVTKLT